MKRKREVKNDTDPEAAQKEVDEIKTNPATVFMENYLRISIKDEFTKHMARSPLKHISDKITGVDTTLFEPNFTKMILRTATPKHGIMLSLHTYFDILSTFASDVNYTLATRHDYGNGLKHVTELELRFEEESIITFEKYEHQKTLSNPATKINKNPVLMALFNDKQCNYYYGYKENDKQHVYLYTAYLNKKFIYSMIIPHTAHTQFQLTLSVENKTSTNNDMNNLMAERYKTNYIALKKSEIEISSLKKQLAEKVLLLKKNENEIKVLSEKNIELTELYDTLQKELTTNKS